MKRELKQQEAEIDDPDNHQEDTWCNAAEISRIPTIYFNGHQLPEKNNVQELKYIL